MPRNTIYTYAKNDTVENRDPYGFDRFAKRNIQRFQQPTGSETESAVVKAAAVSQDRDSFQRGSNASGTSARMVNNNQQGLNSYKRTALNSGGTVDRPVNTKTLGGNAGPSTLRTASSLIGSFGNPKRGILTQQKTNSIRAANIYRAAAFSQNNSSGMLSMGSALSAGRGANSPGGGALSSLRPAAAGNTKGLSAIIKQGISQYKSFEPQKPVTIYEFGEEPDAFIAPEPPSPNSGEPL